MCSVMPLIMPFVENKSTDLGISNLTAIMLQGRWDFFPVQKHIKDFE